MAADEWGRETGSKVLGRKIEKLNLHLRIKKSILHRDDD